jgi:hypothetical protein
LEDERFRTDVISLDRRGAHLNGRVHGREVLPQETRLSAAGPNVLDGKGLACDQRQGEGGAQDLPTPLTE